MVLLIIYINVNCQKKLIPPVFLRSRMEKMYNSEDLEKFYFDYQTEWMPLGISIPTYCSRNNVPYKVLDKWNRDIYQRVIPVQITGTSEEQKIKNPKHTERGQKQTISNGNVSIKFSIITSLCMELSKDGLDYGSLKRLIAKLESLLC